MKINRTSIPFLAILALLFALWAGLLRLGWQLPALTQNLALYHGPLMISGFSGTLITLERAVALKQKWMYFAPLLSGLGWLVTLLISTQALGPLLLTLASLGGVAILTAIVRREPGLFTFAMLLGSLTWLTGNALWLTGRPIFLVVPWWQTFLILTIAGERLELSRILRINRFQQFLFGVNSAILLAGVISTLFDLQLAARLSGAGMIALTLWFIHNDIAWRNLRHHILLTKYIAWCLVLGFVWLGIGGVLNLIYGAQASGPRYDALLHIVFVGFVISMIFGHAPIIFPSILGVPINFQPAFYIQLVLLHLSLSLRVVADMASWHTGRMWGGLLNEAAILLFLGMTVISILREGKRNV